MQKENKSKKVSSKNSGKKYSKPRVKKHENLKEITLLSFTPPPTK
jgi:hypothetical protein